MSLITIRVQYMGKPPEGCDPAFYKKVAVVPSVGDIIFMPAGVFRVRAVHHEWFEETATCVQISKEAE